MITINRKDTYDIKLSKRRVQFTGRCAARTGQATAARHGKAGGKDRALRGHHSRAARHNRGLQVPAGDANQLRSRSGGRRITNRGPRAPSSGRIIKPQASRSKQASSPDQASSGKRQASSDKPQATRSVIASPG